MNAKGILIVLLFVVLFEQGQSDSTSGADRTQCKNACSRVREQICANNGITYDNSCQFECAKARNNRLRIIKTGSCAGTTLREYRGQATPRPTPSPYSLRYGGGGTRGSGGSGSIWDSIFGV